MFGGTDYGERNIQLKENGKSNCTVQIEITKIKQDEKYRTK